MNITNKKTIQAIVYKSNAGHSKKYANLFSQYTGLPVYELEDAVSLLEPAVPIVFFGWLMAGKVMGLPQASNRFLVQAIVAVGMGENGSQMDDIQKNNSFNASIPVFMLQGGFEMDKLHGMYKMMMKVMKTASKKSQKENNLSESGKRMMDMFENGKDLVSLDSLEPVLQWYGSID